jgi:hypothetical protein
VHVLASPFPVWLDGIGSFGALLVAVYVGVIVGVIGRPSLSLRFHPVEGLGDAVVVGYSLSEEEKTDAAYVRLRVGNSKWRRTAENVEVLLLAIDRADKPAPSPNLSDFPLTWSSTEATIRSIAPDHERHIDLCHVLESNPAGSSRRLVMDVHPIPADDRHELAPGRYLLWLAVTASNAAAKRFSIVLDYDGGWEPDIWDHLHVSEGPTPQSAGIASERPYQRLFRNLLNSRPKSSGG